MIFGLNLVDLVIIFALIFFTLEALGKSLILSLLDFINFLLSFFLSLRFYNLFAEFFEDQFHVPHGLSLVLGFIAVWFISEFIFYLLIIRFLIPKVPRLNFNWINRLSVIPAFLKGLIFVALTLVILVTFPVQPAIKEHVLDSRLGSLILNNTYWLESQVKNIFGGLSDETLTFLTIRPQTNKSLDLGFRTLKFRADEDIEFEMIKLVNEERDKVGLNGLEFDAKLREVARVHSTDMFERGYFSHYSPEGDSVADRAMKEKVDFLVIGENLAYAPSLALAHKGLMASEGHRANILGKEYQKIGIGVMDGGVYGMMFTQVFSN